MISIPAGTFMMGSNDGEADEKPMHSVSVAGFEMDRTEVTVNAYQACVNVGACEARTTVHAVGYDEIGGVEK
jgi:eukaryotic-like serine/threonine-protein kinase